MKFGRYYLRQRWILFLVWILSTIGCPIPSAATGPQLLSEITVVYEKDQWHVVLAGTRSMTYRAIKVVDPLRLVLDLANTSNEMHPKPLVVDNEVIGTIKTAQIVHEPQPLTRVEIGLNQNASYKITRQGKEIWVSFNTAQHMTNVEPIRIEPVVEPKVKQAPVTREVATPKPSPKKPIPPSKPLGKSSLPSATKVLSIHQLKMEQELRYYIIANGSLADYDSFHLTRPPRLVLDLMGVKATDIKDTLSFRGPLVKDVRIGVYTSKVRIVFDLIPEAGLPYDVISEEGRLVVSFKPGTGFPAQ